jgi:DNA-binding CsgD family transcriptional regulator
LHLSLSPSDQASVHQLLLAVPEPGFRLLPPGAVEAVGRLVVADVLCVSEIDRRGFMIRGFDEPAGVYDHLGPQCCDGLPPLGLQHLATFPADDEDVLFNRAIGVRDTLRLSFPTASGTVVQVVFDRRQRLFTERDVAVLRLVEPALGNLMRTSCRLAHDDALSPSENRVLELVAAGASNRDVAEHLSVSVATVRKHLEHSYRKLGVGSRTAAVAVLGSPSAPQQRTGSPFG